HSAMSSAPMAQMPRPRRPVMAEPFFPETFDVTRVLADQRFLETEAHDVGTRSLNHRPGDPGVGVGLADSHMAGVGVYLDDNVVLRRGARVDPIVGHQEDETLDSRNLHSGNSSLALRCLFGVAFAMR